MKKYTVTVPIFTPNLTEGNLPKTVAALKDCGAERIFLGTPPFFVDKALRAKFFRELKRYIDYFRKSGDWEIGVWILSS